MHQANRRSTALVALAMLLLTAARKAWLGLVQHIDAQANVTDVCVGTNKANAEVGANPETQLKYYLDRQRKTGDLHGQAPVLWSASALMR